MFVSKFYSLFPVEYKYVYCILQSLNNRQYIVLLQYLFRDTCVRVW